MLTDQLLSYLFDRQGHLLAQPVLSLSMVDNSGTLRSGGAYDQVEVPEIGRSISRQGRAALPSIGISAD